MSAPDPGLPKDPADYRPRPVMGVGFWAMIAFGFLCVLAGAGVAYLGPSLLPQKPQAPAPLSEPAASPAPQPAAAPAPTPDVERLKARIADLESQGARSSEAAAAALAAAGVIDASRTSRPFVGEVAALRAAAPHLPELVALARLAETGAPSRTALSNSFPDFAARAAVRARKPPQDAGISDRVAYAVSKVVQVRRVDDLAGASPDALIARAELALTDGDVVSALRLLDNLPPAGRRALEPWRAGAERRAEIDLQVAGLRARALQDLAPRGGGA